METYPDFNYRKNILAFFIPLMGLGCTFAVSGLFFSARKLYNYNVVGLLSGIEFLFVAPIVFFAGCYLAALLPYWFSKRDRDYIPLLTAVLIWISLLGAQIISTFIEGGLPLPFLRLILSVIAAWGAARLSLTKTKPVARGILRRFFRPGILLVLLAVGAGSMIPHRHPAFPHKGMPDVRDQWAKRNLDPYYTAAVDYARQQATLQQDLGRIDSVAPAPRSENGMYDGYSKFTLEVTGEKGAGICILEFGSYGATDHHFSKAIWQFNGENIDLLKIRAEAFKTLPPEKALEEYPVTLVEAVEMQDPALVQYLIEHGADINAKVHNRTPLESAISNRDRDLVELLLQQGAEIDDHSSLSVVSGFAYDKDIFKLLIKHGLDVNQRVRVIYSTGFKDSGREVSISEMTPLIYAACEGNLELVQFLIEEGVDLDAECVVGLRGLRSKTEKMTALEIAREMKEHEIQAALLAAAE